MTRAVAPLDQADRDADVLIVGAGPVGLTLAYDLGRRGVRATIIEQKAEPAFLPKMERCNARTMEIFRRLGLVDAVGPDVHPTVWEHVLTALGQVRRLEQGTPGQAAFERAVVKRLAPLAARLGWRQAPGEPAAVTQLRPDVLSLLGTCGDPAVLAAAKTQFRAFLKHPASLDNDVRPVVMRLVGRYGSASDFDALLALAERSEDVGEQHAYYDALASTLDLQALLHGWTIVAALTVFAVRIAATRLALWPGTAWDVRKQHAMALSMCSLVSYGGLVVDNTLNAYTGLDATSTAVMGALLALNVLLAPGLTWLGLHLAGETYRGGAQ